MASRIEQIIEEIEEYVDSCKFQPLSTTKIVVNKEELEELLRELRLKTPDEIKRYQKIISNKDAILADAQTKADGIIANAEAKAKELVSQHEVMQQAYSQANDTVNKANQQAQGILDSATQDANNIRLSALSYTDDMLANLGNILSATVDDAGAKYSALISSLQNALNTVKQNRQELAPQTQGQPDGGDTSAAKAPQDETDTSSEDDDFDDEPLDEDEDRVEDRSSRREVTRSSRRDRDDYDDDDLDDDDDFDDDDLDDDDE